MKQRTISFCWVATGVLAFSIFGSTSGAVTPTPAELSQAKEWYNGCLDRRLESLPISLNYGGTPFQRLAGAWRVNPDLREREDGSTLCDLAMTHEAAQVGVHLAAVRYDDFPAVEWVVTIQNGGPEKTPILDGIHPLDIRLPIADGPVTLHHSLGDSNSADSFKPVEDPLEPGAAPLVFAPSAGRSSDPHLPFFNLQWQGGGVVVAVGWSGQWEASFDRPEQGVVHLRAGQQTTHFSLEPGESIRTPRILLVFWEGANPLRGNNLLRQVLLAHHLPRRGGELVFPPVCASVTNVDPDGTYEGPHVRVMPALAKRGIEVFWSDMDPQQWYPGGFPKGTGTWEVDTAKYPNGLKPVGEAAHASGLGYLLWFEPERVAAGTRIATEHPEWVSGGEDGGLFKLHLPEARQYMLETIDRHVSDAQLTWVRWDFNIEPLKYWRECDAPDRDGITEIRHIEGLYAFWDELRRRHPGLVIDNCASGGRRIDLETCMRSLPLWHSDLQCFGIHPGADQLQNGGLFRWIPFHGCGNFGYEPSYVFRSALTGGNILAPSSPKGGLSTADEDTEQAAKRSVEVSKSIRPFLLGDFHPLFPHNPAEDVWYGYQFHREDLKAGVAVLFRREKAPESNCSISLQGIDSAKRYEVWSEENQERRPVRGATLATFPVEIRELPGSSILYYAVSKD